MDKFDLLVSIVPYINEFADENRQIITEESFINWLLLKKATHTAQYEVSHPAETTLDDNITIQLTVLSRFGRLYIKQSLQGSPLQSVDEFVYLINMLHRESLTKTELIENAVGEKTTGIEIIKRLVKNGYLREWSDAADGRMKRVALTEAGTQLLYSLFARTSKVSSKVAGNLTNDEKLLLLQLLNKLETHHRDLQVKKELQVDFDINNVTETQQG